MSSSFKFPLLLGLALSLALSGCVTTSTPMSSSAGNQKSAPRTAKSTAMHKAINGCVASIGVGLLVGAIVDKRRGAVVGATVGGIGCLALIEVANVEDRARIAEEEARAVRANASRTRTIKTQKGKTARVKTVVRPAPKPKAAPTLPVFAPAKPATEANVTACRTVEQTVTVSGASSKAPAQIWCRVEGGDWQPWN